MSKKYFIYLKDQANLLKWQNENSKDKPAQKEKEKEMLILKDKVFFSLMEDFLPPVNREDIYLISSLIADIYVAGQNMKETNKALLNEIIKATENLKDYKKWKLALKGIEKGEIMAKNALKENTYLTYPYYSLTKSFFDALRQLIIKNA